MSNGFLPLSFSKTCLPGFLLLFLSHLLNAQNIEDIPRARPIAVSGMLDIRGIAYHAKGIDPRRKDFSYFINGSPVFSLYGITIPVSFTISEQERSVRQPFNQFGLSPYYKWIKLHAGYRNIQFSPYTLGGHTMLGAGFELTPGKWRMGFMYGRLNRATAIDTTTGMVQSYSFSRKGYAALLGFGTEKRLVEISLLSAKDDSNSIRQTIPDSLKTIAPAANAAGSIRAVYSFAEKLYFEADAGASLYTFNTGATAGIPPGLASINKLLRPFTRANASSQVNLAYTATLTYRERNYSVKLGYRHIDPEFQSMGVYFFNNDVEQYTLSPAFTAAKGKFRFNGSIGFQKDNLRRQKTATTKRVIGSANISYEISDKLGVDANYVNYSTNATPQVVNVSNKYLLAQTTHNIAVTPRYVIASEKYTHAVVLGDNYSTIIDLNQDTKNFNDISTNVVFLNYNLTFNRIALTLITAGNYTTTRFSVQQITMYGITLGASKTLSKTRLQVGTSNSISKTNQYGSATVLNLGANAGYNVSAHHRFSLRWSMIDNRPDRKTVSAKAFTEQTGELGYTLSF